MRNNVHIKIYMYNNFIPPLNRRAHTHIRQRECKDSNVRHNKELLNKFTDLLTSFTDHKVREVIAREVVNIIIYIPQYMTRLLHTD